MSVWQKENIAEKVVDILKKVTYKDENHHLGNPFLTSYQLAIEFLELYPDVVKQLPSHNQIGGVGSGLNNSLAQYLGLQLSSHYDDIKKLGVEGGFLSNNNITSLSFQGKILPSVPDISIFRYNPSIKKTID